MPATVIRFSLRFVDHRVFERPAYAFFADADGWDRLAAGGTGKDHRAET